MVPEWLIRAWGLPADGPRWLRWGSRLVLVGVAVLVWPVMLAVVLFRREGPTWMSRLIPTLLIVLWIPWVGAIAQTDWGKDGTTTSTASTTGTPVAVNQFADTGTDEGNDDDGVPPVGATKATSTSLSASSTQPIPTTAPPTTTVTTRGVTSTFAPPVLTTPMTIPITTTTARVVASGLVSVVWITDGDTIKVLVGGITEPLRLIGINAPEGGECMAAEASARLTALVGGQSVRLESDVSDRDIYDRLLRYVYLGDLFVNRELVREGLALARRYEPDTAKASILESAQAQAEADQVGMWASDACGVAATDDIRVGTIRYDADGNDNENLNDEWVEIVNQGVADVDLTGWGVKDESASHRYTFPNGFNLGGGATVRLHTGCGTDTATFLYWCNTGSAIWNNDGDTVFILDPSGNIVDSKSY